MGWTVRRQKPNYIEHGVGEAWVDEDVRRKRMQAVHALDLVILKSSAQANMNLWYTPDH
jgi:hypothetical protein